MTDIELQIAAGEKNKKRARRKREQEEEQEAASDNDEKDSEDDADEDASEESEEEEEKEVKRPKRKKKPLTAEQQAAADAAGHLSLMKQAGVCGFSSVTVMALLCLLTITQLNGSFGMLVLLLIMCMMVMAQVCVYIFYRGLLQKILPVTNRNFNVTKDFANQFIHIAGVGVLILILMTGAMYQTVITVALQLNKSANCASGIFQAFLDITAIGQAVYVLDILNFFFSLFSFAFLIKYAYVMSVYYIKQCHLLHMTAGADLENPLPHSNPPDIEAAAQLAAGGHAPALF